MSTANTLRALIIATSICTVFLSTPVRADEDDEDDDEYYQPYQEQVYQGYSYQQPVYQPEYAYRPPSYQVPVYPRSMMPDALGNPMAYGNPSSSAIQAVEGVVLGLLNGR